MNLEPSGNHRGSCYASCSVKHYVGFVTSITYFRKPFLNIRFPLVRLIATNITAQTPTEKSVCLSKGKPARMQSDAERQVHLMIDRESFLRNAALIVLSTMQVCTNVLADTQFSTYKGPISLGFSFSYPSSWTITKKVIKTHLSEVIVSSKDDSSTTAGLVVDAVKIDAIDRFGTPETVAQKVVDVEKKKDSVKQARILSTTSISKDGLTYYVIDYTVDSTRGQKRYIAKATITANQLYVFTAQTKEDEYKGETAELLSRMLDSFSVVKQYS